MILVRSEYNLIPRLSCPQLLVQGSFKWCIVTALFCLLSGFGVHSEGTHFSAVQSTETGIHCHVTTVWQSYDHRQ